MLALAFRNLFSHPGRNALTAVSVTIAMMLVTFVVAAQLQSRRLLTMVKGRNNMIVAAKAGTMPLSFQKQIESIPGVKRVLYMYVSDTTSSDRRFSFMLHATTADYTTIRDSWFYVPPEALTRWGAEHTGALVGHQRQHSS